MRSATILAVLLLLTSALLLAAPRSARAQDEQQGFDLQLNRPLGTRSLNYYAVHTTRTLHQWDLEFGSIVLQSSNLLRQRDPDTNERVRVVDSRTTLTLFGALGITDWAEVALDQPIYLRQTGEGGDTTLLENLGVARGFGPGDTRLALKVGSLRREEGIFRGIAFVGNMYLPLGNDDRFQGESFRVHPQVVVDLYPANIFSLSANAGFMPRSDREFGRVEVDDTFTFGAAADLILLDGALHLVPEMAGGLFLHAERFGVDELPVDWRVGGEYHFRNGTTVALNASTGIGAGSSAFEGGLSVTHVTPVTDPDVDGDGILNRDDACPEEPEDIDGFEDLDGCPDPDNDGDGLLDDGDACPMEPEDPDGFEDLDGCPDRDNDGDEILDVLDRCPLEPEDVDGNADEDGCPDPDDDGDKVNDTLDQCPGELEDYDDFEDLDGCVEPDNDGDGLLDAVDECPIWPENFNGNADEDGCPDDDIGCEALPLDDRVLFESNEAIILEASFGLLEGVAQVILDHPDIILIRVEGHTDSSGDAEDNLVLSHERALSVVAFLVEHGVAPERLVAAGFGPTVPIADNETREGRAENRRVVFALANREGCPMPDLAPPPALPDHYTPGE